MSENWRLIITPPLPGARNMALDEALMHSAATKREPPTLRLYTWEVPTLSLGYSQSSKDVNLSSLEQFGWGLVRRPTGGRAILHTDELTYSITAPMDDSLVSGNLLESYQRISKALLKALQNLGINARADSEYSNQGNSDRKGPVCFEVPSNYEITVRGKKLIGSAQARKNNGVLQHGSLPLYGDLSRITFVLHYNDGKLREKSKESLLEHAGTILSLTGLHVTLEDAQNAFISAFSSALDISFTACEPGKEEWAIASELEKTKYGSPNWTFRS